MNVVWPDQGWLDLNVSLFIYQQFCISWLWSSKRDQEVTERFRYLMPVRLEFVSHKNVSSGSPNSDLKSSQVNYKSSISWCRKTGRIHKWIAVWERCYWNCIAHIRSGGEVFTASIEQLGKTVTEISGRGILIAFWWFWC